MKYLQITERNTEQIVSTADLKTHCRISTSEDDTYLEALESAARQTVEEFCNIFLLETSVTQYGFELIDTRVLFKSPIYGGSSTRAFYVYKSGAWTSQSDVEFITESEPARVYTENANLDEPDSDIKQKYKVTYKVGYDSVSDIPNPLIQAIKIMVATMYENRQSVIVGKTVSEIPKTAEYLMQNYKVQTL
tara:strand:+ start:4321 stop:4893 length:573 start_codon:yes stop_codon:yes gene_type:complete